MPRLPFVQYIEREIPATPSVEIPNRATTIIIGTATAGPVEPTLLRNVSDVDLFIYKGEETEAVKRAREILQAGGQVLFIRLIHPEVEIAW